MVSWDIFIDERKKGKNIETLGLTCFCKGLVCQYYEYAIRAKDKINQKHGNIIKEIKWTNLNQSITDVVIEWLKIFFKGPMSFFILVLSNKKNKFDMFKEVIEKLESDDKVPHGLDRKLTTAHFDYDSQDTKNLWTLERNFGLLRTFPWDSKSSPLLQLTDILLNITYNEYKGNSFNTGSIRDKYRKIIVDNAKKYYIENNKRTKLAVYEKNGNTKIIFD